MKIVAICQARLASTRLPGKMLLPLAGAPLLQRVLERVQRATRLDEIVLAVPHHDALTFLPLARTRAHLFPYHGEESDLVGRYLAAATAFGADLIVRIPCDNPCIDPSYIDQAIDGWFSEMSPFITNTTASCGGQWIDGIGAEVFSFNRLQWLDHVTRQRDPSLREHLHRFFCAYLPQADLRLDINTQDDYDFIAGIYDALYSTHPHFTPEDILSYLTTKEVSHAAQERVQ
jgi:spore coat polysaccharide biosynthesis protein SpsF